MARFFDKVGYKLPDTVVDDVYTANIVERDHYGEVRREVRTLVQADKVNDDISLQHRISIVADAFISENYAYIAYVKLDGVRWTVTSVEVDRPRLILDLGGVYNGESPTG